MEINICLSSDDNYAQHLAVTITSILKNAKKSDNLFFHILDGGITDENKLKIKKLKKIRDFFIEYNDIDTEIFKKFPLISNHISTATYFRYMISTIFPHLKKIIYLDVDIVVNDSLSELYETNIDEYYMAGVEDVGYVHHRLYDNRLHYKFFYINAGVLLINIARWRAENIQEKLFEYTVNNFERIQMCMDQDVLNAVLHKKCLPLDYKWNVQNSFYRTDLEVATNGNSRQILEAAKNPSIIHFAGPIKPWTKYADFPMAYLYRKHLRQTSWKHNLPSEFQIKMHKLKKYLICSLKNIFAKNKPLNIDFIKYLERKDAQKRINKLAEKYFNKKIVLYGAGLFADTIFKNYDLSKLNIIYIADMKFNQQKEFHGLEVIAPCRLKTIDFDVLLVSLHDDSVAWEFIEEDLFFNLKSNFKKDILIKMSFWEYVNHNKK